MDFVHHSRTWNFFRGIFKRYSVVFSLALIKYLADGPILTTNEFPADLDTTSIGLMVTQPDDAVFTSIMDEMLQYTSPDGIATASTVLTNPSHLTKPTDLLRHRTSPHRPGRRAERPTSLLLPRTWPRALPDARLGPQRAHAPRLPLRHTILPNRRILPLLLLPAPPLPTPH